MKFKGTVVKGAGRGKELQFPTANLQTEIPLTLKKGIWACWVTLKNRRYKSAASYGLNPTFDDVFTPQFEVHLLDYTGADFYGETLLVEATIYLRDEVAFTTVEKLIEQIEADCQQVRALLSE